MKRCLYCGNKVKDDDTFCSEDCEESYLTYSDDVEINDSLGWIE